MSTVKSHPPCPLCDGESAFRFNAGDLFYRVTTYRADLFRCGECGADFQWPIPDRATLAGFYPSGYWVESETPGLMERLQQLYIRTMLKLDLMAWVRRLRLKPGSEYLDIGCGRGDWAGMVAAKGFRVQGLEADPRAAEYARRKYGLQVTVADDDSWDPEMEAWDALTLFHLLEHVTDPHALLSKCRKALRQGGKLLIRIPNPRSWQAKLFGKRWKGWELPRHVVLFHPHLIRNLLHEHGFTVRKLSTWSLRDGPPAAASSLYPDGEPTRRLIFRRSGSLPVLFYLLLTWACFPFELVASWLGAGSMITVIAEKRTVSRTDS